MTYIRHRFLFFDQSASVVEAFSCPSRGRFDDFTVTHTKSPVIQAEDYYPFGLVASSYRRENSLEQNYLYNGKELQDELSLGWLDYGARMYMPEIGRWGVMDIMSEIYPSMSSYSYAANNPLLFVDIDGQEIYIYFISADFSFGGMFGHNALGVKIGDERTYMINESGSYREGELKNVKDNSGNVVYTYIDVDEQKTIQKYVDQGDEVLKMKIKLPDKVEKEIRDYIIDVQMGARGATSFYCTDRVKEVIHGALVSSGYDKKRADEIINQIMPYSLPTNMDEDELKEAGFHGYDKFSKDEDGSTTKESKKWDASDDVQHSFNKKDYTPSQWEKLINKLFNNSEN